MVCEAKKEKKNIQIISATQETHTHGVYDKSIAFDDLCAVRFDKRLVSSEVLVFVSQFVIL